MIDYNLRPILVFWETTKACKLKCKHCRAEAILEPLPGELSTDEAYKLLDMIKRFGKPYPVLIFTGGDPLMRRDLPDLLRYSQSNGIPTGIAPAVSELLNEDTMNMLRKYDVRYVSISLDGGSPDTHDGIRGIEGHYSLTINVLKKLMKRDFKVQVNTLVARKTVNELPLIARKLRELGIDIWELFFLIKVGRGVEVEDLTPREYEDVVHFLYEVSRYGFEVRTVEAPFYRRVAVVRRVDEYDADHLDIKRIREKYSLGKLYVSLVGKLVEYLGNPPSRPEPHVPSTRDGKGIIFVSHDGEIYPSGFAPYKLGNVKRDDLVKVYRENTILKKIRDASFHGRCGVCMYRDLCGGSRARAYAESGDILGEDPACIYIPR